MLFEVQGHPDPGRRREVDDGRRAPPPGERGGVRPTPATHAILTVLKAGETVYQADALPKTL